MIYSPPLNISTRDFQKTSIFIAGTIENGKSFNWQAEISHFLSNDMGFNIFNPRRADWNSSLELEYENPQFNQQVNWELNALEVSDIILMYFDPNSKSPISLLELGLFARSGKLNVICPDGYWRKGNVDIVCDKYNIPMYNNLLEFRLYLKHKYEK